MPIRSFRLPIFLICCNCVLKSQNQIRFFRIFFFQFSGFGGVELFLRFSTRLTMSPMPRIRCAIPLRIENIQGNPSFPPLLVNLMGFINGIPYRQGGTAPYHRPVWSIQHRKIQSFVKCGGGIDRILASHTIHHKPDFLWLNRRFWILLVIIASSTARRPAVSMMMTFLFWIWLPLMAFLCNGNRILVFFQKTSTPI